MMERILSAQRLQLAVRRCFSAAAVKEEEEQEEDQDRYMAAVTIQSGWRGMRCRQEVEQRRARYKPAGFYTHTLGLTYISDRRKKNVVGRRALFLMLEDPGSGPLAQALSLIIMGSIALSIVGFVLETVPRIYDSSPQAWFVLEVVCTMIFTAEFGGRFAVCDQAGIARRDFLLNPANILDVLAILPFYIEVLLMSCGVSDGGSLRAVKAIRLVRVLRVLKMGRYASGLRLTAKALAASWNAISVLFFLLGMGVVVFSSALYYLEKLSCPAREDMSQEDLLAYASQCDDEYYHGVSPSYGLCCTEDGAPNDFPSIIAATWWSLVTMSSVGYGDIYPKTIQGKCVGAMAMLGGMVALTLPVAIVGQKFQDVYQAHTLHMARFQAVARMKVPGEQWSLVPDSGNCAKLRNLLFNDPALSNSVMLLASNLEEVWHYREMLMRERKLVFQEEDSAYEHLGSLVVGLHAALDDACS